MEAVTAKAGISVLVMLFGFLQDGLKKLEQKEYPGAVVAFTKVIEHEQADVDLRGQALLWRAMAHGRSGKLPEAKADLAKMLDTTHDDALQEKALTAFAELGGDPRSLLPDETPKAAFERTKAAGLTENVTKLRQQLAGDISAAVGTMERMLLAGEHGAPGHAIAAVLESLEYDQGQAGVDGELGSARAAVLVDQGRLRLRLGLVPHGSEWRFSSLLAAERVVAAKPAVAAEEAVRAEAAEAAAAQAVAEANEMKAKAMAEQAAANAVEMKAKAAAQAQFAAVRPTVVVLGGQTPNTVEIKPTAGPEGQAAKLKKVVTALALCASQRSNVPPDELDAVKPVLGDDADVLTYTDPATKAKLPLLYHKAASNDPTVSATRYLVATPVPYQGKRLVAFVDGHVAAVPEEEFMKTAKEQGWKDTGGGILLPEDELKTKVAQLVTQLGDAKHSVRKGAYRELRKLKKQAEPILETYRDHPDPEVRLSVRKLLKKKPKPVATPMHGGMGMGGMGGMVIWDD